MLVRMIDGEILEVEPETIVGHQNIPSNREGVGWPDI